MTADSLKFASMNNTRKLVVEIMAAMDWTQSEIAENVGVSQSTINRWLQGDDARGKNLSRLQTVYERTVKTAHSSNSEEQIVTYVSGIEIKGAIRAGKWLDTTLMDDDYEPKSIPVARDDRFPKASQYALEVQGDSMNLEFPEGTFVVCVDLYESNLSLQDGMFVHVERQNGPLRENTLKLLRRNGSSWQLEPRSTNTAHQAITFNGKPDDGEHISIRGVVIGDYRRRSF